MMVDGRLDKLALAAVAAATGASPYQPRKQRKTYVARGGKRFHLRTRTKEDDGEWFHGINERCWKAGEYFVLACGGPDAMFVVPVDEFPAKDEFSPSGTDRKIHVVCRRGQWYLRDPYPRFVLDQYRDAFRLLV